MPIYEYTCKDCDAQFEKFARSVATVPEVTCPSCGGRHLKKGWSVFGTTNAKGGPAGLATSGTSDCGPVGT
jgi:putative FmdB family regulatory protein